MKLYDSGVDLDEANATGTAMYSILKDQIRWRWPDPNKHLSLWKDVRDELIQEEGESDKAYVARAARWRRWPSVKTNEQAQWLHYAIITSRAHTYLQTCHMRGLAARW